MALRGLSRVLEAIAGSEPLEGVEPSLTLSDLLERQSIEDSGLFRSRVYEASPRPLTPRLPHPGRSPPLRYIAVDSSSRLIETPSRSIVLTVVSVSSTSPLELYDHPGVYRYPVEPREPPPYIAVSPGPMEVWPATGRSPWGETYSGDEPREAIMDGWRIALENWAIREVVDKGLWGSHLNILLVDGPLTPYPASHPRDAGRGWEVLAGGRASAVERLEAMGVPVIGVVKRVERSMVIGSTPELASMVEDCTGHEGGGDRMLIHLLVKSRCFKWIPGRIYTTPKVLINPSMGGGLTKLVEYLVMPQGRWQMRPHTARVYRIEYTPTTLEILRSHKLEPHQVIALDSILRGSRDPVTLHASDRRAKMISKALRRLIAWGLTSRGVPLSYSSEVEVSR